MDFSDFIRFYINVETRNHIVSTQNIPQNIPQNPPNRPSNEPAKHPQNSSNSPSMQDTSILDYEPEIIEFNWEGFDIKNTIKINLSSV